MKRNFILLMVALNILVLWSCTSLTKSQFSAPFYSNVNAEHIKADVVTGEKISGSASKTTIFKIFSFGLPGKYASGVNYGNSSGFAGVGYDSFSLAKEAAAYDAVSKSNADIIVNPEYVIEENDYFLFSTVHVTVTGFKGTIKGLKNEEPVTPKEVVIAPKVSEPIKPKEVAVVPKVEEPVTQEEVVVAPKVSEPAASKSAVVAASFLLTAYSGHVASFKSEHNAIIFVKKMKAKGLIAFYQKEDVPGKGKLYRSYIGRYKTGTIARKALTKLKKAGEIDYFQIQKMAEKDGKIVTKEMEIGAQKNEPAQKSENQTAPSIDTQHYYEGIKGIVLKNGKVIKGQIISIDNDVLKIRTKKGKILTYSFMKEVKEYITEREI